ncbi:MAG: hypothetical protein M5R36_00995 [Deltaproteobacteria bacterium]|nr:hypothetical protein [Deltaproteobacteria bacterium]
MAQTIANLRSAVERFKGRLENVARAADEETPDGMDVETPSVPAETTFTDRDIDEFLSLVRHELKTPLTSVLASTEALLSDIPLPLEQQEGFLHIIQSEARRLTRLIDDLTHIARLEGQDVPIRKSPFNLPELIRHVALTNRSLADAKHIQIVPPGRTDGRPSGFGPRGFGPHRAAPNEHSRQRDKVQPRGRRHHLQNACRGEEDPRPRDGPGARQRRGSGAGYRPARAAPRFREIPKIQNVEPQSQGLPGSVWPSRSGSSSITADASGFTSRPGRGTIFHFTLPFEDNEPPVGESPGDAADEAAAR